MVKVLNITINDRNFIFCFAYFFVRPSVHVYFDILRPVFLELGRLMLSVCLTMIQPKSTSLSLSCPFSLSCYLSCSNVDSVLGEDHNTHFLKRKFRRNLSEIFQLRSSCKDTGKWEASIYSDDPATFQAHLAHHFKRACEIIECKFTFFSVQDRTMTEYVRRILTEIVRNVAA